MDMARVGSPVGLITALDRIGGHRTISEFHSLPHQTTDATKMLRKDPGRKVGPHWSKSNYRRFSVPHRTSQISLTSL